ncbi:MAG: hypothetical protein FXV79_01110 [Candidatus Thioglobus sp.]|nr:MAG: hypothetical protein FXV80_06060 [Candidatus Thioglobus sp.]KAA0455936.1 MAG: hypothetical protein FXV79_01110 [Candidatus Thioglobus sp.]
MGFIKLIIYALPIFVAFYLFKKFSKRGALKTQASSSKMVECSACATHIPENEALIQNGKIYCCKDCL